MSAWWLGQRRQMSCQPFKPEISGSLSRTAGEANVTSQRECRDSTTHDYETTPHLNLDRAVLQTQMFRIKAYVYHQQDSIATLSHC